MANFWTWSGIIHPLNVSWMHFTTSQIKTLSLWDYSDWDQPSYDLEISSWISNQLSYKSQCLWVILNWYKTYISHFYQNFTLFYWCCTKYFNEKVLGRRSEIGPGNFSPFFFAFQCTFIPFCPSAMSEIDCIASVQCQMTRSTSIYHLC